VAMPGISQERDGRREPTPGEDGHPTGLAESAGEAIKGHGREMTHDRPQRQTQPPMHRQRDIAGHLRSHGAIAVDKMREDRAHDLAPCTLAAPDGEPPSWTRTSCEWRVRHPPPPQVAVCMS
jgi:hypothetical protein